MKNKNLIAWALLILLAIIWGSSPILIKKALIKLDPFEIGALRLTLASFVLFPFLAKNLKEIRRKGLPNFIYLRNSWQCSTIFFISYSSNKNR